MKLATYKDGSRDGQLVVVSRDLSRAHYATGIAHRLQQVLDDWNFLSPQLQDLYDALNRLGEGSSGTGLARYAFEFEPDHCMAPLPRACQWANSPAPAASADGLDKATDVMLYQGASDRFAGPCDDVPCTREDLDIDFSAGVAVVTGEVQAATSVTQALDAVRLVMLSNAWCLRALEPLEQAHAMGLVQSRFATAFGPVAVSPDELGPAWVGGRADLSLQVRRNNKTAGLCDAGAGAAHHFGELIAHLCQTRCLSPGTIVGTGLSSSGDAARGRSCIAHQRALEVAPQGGPSTEYMKFGDRIFIEANDRDGQSVFGAIDQRVVPLARGRARSV